MKNEKDNLIKSTPFIDNLGFALTKDGVLKEIYPDFIIETLTEEQLSNWKKAIEEKDNEYFVKNTISVDFTTEQHEAITKFIKDAFAQLNKENGFESEFVKILITDHFMKRVRERKARKLKTSILHTVTIREFITKYQNVENAFRWSDKGLSYRLKNNAPTDDPSSYERISFSVFLGKDQIIIYINVITFINKQRKKKKKKKNKKKK